MTTSPNDKSSPKPKNVTQQETGWDFVSRLVRRLGVHYRRDAIYIPFWKQWAFKWSTPGGIAVMLPGVRIYGPTPKLPKGTTVHLTAGRWKSQRFHHGKIHWWIVAREILPTNAQGHATAPTRRGGIDGKEDKS